MSSPITLREKLQVHELGVIDYLTALQMQRNIHESIVQQSGENTLLLLEHPSVYTAGRRTQIQDRPLDDTPVIDVDRGGKITWHGPGQLVGYPILRLKNPTDVVGFVRVLETALISVCAEFGIKADRYCERSGVWVRDEKGDRKIAAIGLRVAKAVTMHGFALNVNPGLAAFEKIIPCGFPGAKVTSISAEIGRNITLDEVTPIVTKFLIPAFDQVC